jgi:hypothetical protein
MKVEERDVSVELSRGQANLTGFGPILYGNGLVGPFAGGSYLLIKFNLSPPFSVARPHIIHFQPRQSENTDYRWPEQFNIMITETSRDFVKASIMRMDGFQVGTGWGQNLMVDVIVVDDGQEPLSNDG